MKKNPRGQQIPVKITESNRYFEENMSNFASSAVTAADVIITADEGVRYIGDKVPEYFA